VLPPRFRRNVVSAYLNIVVSALILLVMTPVLVRGLGKGGYGLWVLLTSLAPYATLLDLGLGSATVKYVGEYYGRDTESTSRTISTSLSKSRRTSWAPFAPTNNGRSSTTGSPR